MIDAQKLQTHIIADKHIQSNINTVTSVINYCIFAVNISSPNVGWLRNIYGKYKMIIW